MLFNSLVFIFIFFPIALLLFTLLAPRSGRGTVLLLGGASLAFYAWGEARFLPLLSISIIGNYFAGRSISHFHAQGRLPAANRLMSLAIIINVAVLGVFKYTDFLLSSISAATGLPIDPLSIQLPLGISFFTFTQIAFLVDAAKGEAKEYDFPRYLLFVTYFPHLIAGPILHHREMMPQFARFGAGFRLNTTAAGLGLTCFAIGLFKKLGIADSVAPVADIFYQGAATGLPLSMAEAWVGALAYTFQIYFDFSGYCDMAIGLSLLFGVRLPGNFNSPYKATSIIDFWRRWHITLSRFLRDYLYIALGGNRRGQVRRYVNLLVTMVLGGLWHGAGWTFVIWGGLHGLYLIINHSWRSINLPCPAWIGRILTFTGVVVAWVFFRADSATHALIMLKAMAGMDGYSLMAKLTFPNEMLSGRLSTTIVGLGLLLSVWYLPNTQQLMGRFKSALEKPPAVHPALHWRPNLGWGIAAGLVFAVSVTLVGGDSPFLYFRF